MKKRLLSLAFAGTLGLSALAQGWPASYGGVMLQGFYWDSFADTQWSALTAQTSELSPYFSLIWVPQSGRCLESYNTMGYTPYYYFNQNSSFGTEAELRQMISTFKAAGIGTIADVVVNHHNTSGWFSFPAETYGGETYQFVSTDIVSNDDSGKTAVQAASEGVLLSSNADTGEGWDGMRDLDHKSANVQRIVTAYVKYLASNLGYTGFRYDMVKGFSPSYVAAYNDAAGISFSVGEYFDGNVSSVSSWVSGTSMKSGAFDFPFRYTVRDAINNDNWLLLAPTTASSRALIANDHQSGAYRQYAVTFVENHDTERRSSAEQDPILKDTLAANAYLLAMPGTPCVFFRHWQDCKQDIKGMIDARHAAGITNTSSYVVLAGSNTKGQFAVRVTGEKAGLACIVGPDAQSRTVSGYTTIIDGYKYRYQLQNTAETAWIDRASGEYTGAVDVRLTAVSATSGASVVYTTDGSAPSATNGTVVASGTTITLNADCTLRAALLIGTTLGAEQTRTYTFTAPFEPKDITVYVNADASGWNVSSGLNFWTWGGDGTHAPTKTTWPGDRVSTTQTVGGKTWFSKTFTLNAASDYVSFVWSAGSGSPQTADVAGVTTTSFFEINAATDASGHNTVTDVTADYVSTSIAAPTIAPAASARGIYTLDGRRLSATTTDALSPGLYIVDGQKVLVR